ncbi:hypothetical protein Moror_17321 [Moniliophthora roreri MCA 2997]|uniref:F-box domain-containing protein n=2 Tax=Moniliophthora roreri TaxID=221103 RepID=V2XVV0_MONRO|nr:hypothetical protein Moror_17321 [Moniliophthora roreri MCA 2997]
MSHPVTLLFKRVPVEVWNEIFRRACLESPLDGSPSYDVFGDSEGITLVVKEGGDDIRATTYNLSRVSSHWRAIVIASPQLWSSIHIQGIHVLRRNLAFLVDLYLRHSKSYPLKISLDALDNFHLSDVEGLHPHSLQVMNCLMKHAHRVQDLSLEMSRYSVLHNMDFQGVSFDILRSFRAGYVLVEDASPSRSFWDALARSGPTFSHLSIETESSLLDTFFPCEQLVSLTFQPTILGLDGLLGFLRVLRRFTRLEVLEMTELDWRDASPELPAFPVELLSLRKLSLSPFTPFTGLSHLFSSLILPSLRVLEICTHRLQSQHNFDAPLEAFIVMLSRSAASLERLVLRTRSIRIFDSRMSEVLQSLPNLVYLDITVPERKSRGELDDDGDIRAFHRLLTILTSDELVLPKASHIILNCLDHFYGSRFGNSDTAELVVKVMESRSCIGISGVSPCTVCWLELSDGAHYGSCRIHGTYSTKGPFFDPLFFSQNHLERIEIQLSRHPTTCAIGMRS